MCSICNDRIETVPDKMLLFTSELIEFFRRTQFCDRLFCHICFQPVNEFSNRHSVFNVCEPLIFHLCRVLDSFRKKCQIYLIQNHRICRNIAHKATVDTGFGEKDSAAGRYRLYVRINFIIWINFHSVSFQILTDFLRKGTDICI